MAKTASRPVMVQGRTERRTPRRIVPMSWYRQRRVRPSTLYDLRHAPVTRALMSGRQFAGCPGRCGTRRPENDEAV